MKRMITFVAVVVTMSGFAIAQEQASPLEKNSDASGPQAKWKDEFEKRMNSYQKGAESIRAATELNNTTEISASIEKVAAQLPATSFHRKNLLDLAKSLKQTPFKKAETENPFLEETKAQLTSIADQLSFRPTMEAEMPAGFPAPTPVGEIEIKSYPAYRMVKTQLEGEPANGKGASSFFRLFNHIQSNDIAMTSPVEMTYEKNESGLTESTMAFLYQNKNIGEVKEDGKISVVDVTRKQVIAMGLRGRPDKEEINKVAEELRSHSAAYAALFELANDVRVMGYNGPSIPEADQFYEVQLELKKKPVKFKTATTK